VSVADWQRYYDCAGDAPRDTLLLALECFDREGARSRAAVDLGCGTGRDTAELLRRGWEVLAIDAQDQAIRRLRTRLGRSKGLTTSVAAFAEATWPQVQLVNASYSLPFAAPNVFRTVWQRIWASLTQGGRFSGQLFGDRGEWARAPDESKREITFHSREQVEELVRRFAVERLDEVEEDGRTAVGDPKHWHLYHLVLRKP
jgi:SAM-dependent methyltransferase